MAESKHQLLVTIGAALSTGFNSAISGSISKIKGLGSAIQDMEKKSVLSASSFSKMGEQYNSLLGSINKQQAIIQKRAFYRSQILEVAALGAALVAPIKSAMKFEDSLAQIKQVVNFTATDGLQKLGAELSKLSREIPLTSNELAKIAAIGGQFGVSANELAEFSKEVGKTAVAWRAPVEETAERVGNLMKVFNASTSQLPTYFDAINELGNKTGATANQILQAVNRSSDGLANFKLSIPQVAALTGTIISFGEGAEQAGTAVGTILQKLSIAPQLGESAQKALHSIGMSSVTLPKLIQQAPQKALNKLFTGLSKLDPENRSSAMYNIFGRGAAKAVGKLVDNLDLYRHNFSLVADQSLFDGSRNGDYNIVLAETNSQFSLLKNNLIVFSQEIGSSLLPTLKNIISTINGVLSPIMDWMSKNKELVGTITKAVAGFISFRIATFVFGYALTFLFGGMNRLAIIAKTLRLGLNIMGTGVQDLFFRFLKFTGIAGTVAGGFLGISEGIDGGLVFSFETLISRINWLAGIGKTKIKTFWESLTNVKIPSFIEKFKAFSNDLKNMGISGIIDRIKTFDFKFKLPNISAWFNEIYAKAQNSNIDLKFKLPDLSQITQYLEKKLSQVDFSILSEKIKLMFSELLDSKNFSLPNNIFENLNLSALELSGCIAVLGASFFVLPNVIGIAGSALVTLISLIPIAISGFSGLFQASWFLISTVLPGLGGMLWDVSGKLWYLGGKALPYVTKAFGILANVTKAHPIIAGLTAALTIGYWIYENWGHIGERISGFFTSLYNGVSKIFKGVWDWCEGIWNFIGDFLNAVGTLGKVFGGVLKNVSSGIRKFVFGEDVKIPIVEEIKESSFWKKFSFGNKKDNATQKLELPKIEPMHSEINRIQNNNFTINIQADKKDDAEKISQKVMSRVSDFSKTFLYDAVPEVL